MDAQAGAVLVDPAAQARPAADQRLVRDVDTALAACSSPARRQQARVGERAHDRLDRVAPPRRA